MVAFVTPPDESTPRGALTGSLWLRYAAPQGLLVRWRSGSNVRQEEALHRGWKHPRRNRGVQRWPHVDVMNERRFVNPVKRVGVFRTIRPAGKWIGSGLWHRPNTSVVRGGCRCSEAHCSRLVAGDGSGKAAHKGPRRAAQRYCACAKQVRLWSAFLAEHQCR